LRFAFVSVKKDVLVVCHSGVCFKISCRTSSLWA